jgi:diaminohydroxyphosphoribosylaminopyrimidine deaminase/5-amino-6-(5-phosphoribosylamino)uracil reductase
MYRVQQAGLTGPVTGTSSAPVAWSDADLAFMARARELARLGAGRTWTNPMVGAVVVSDGREAGSGHHARLGGPHAEAGALELAGAAARGATLYVNLEPCAHQGRTPPCVEAVAAAGISRVVIPALDPDPRVRGRGVAWLRARGIRVDVGCDAAAAILDNHGYYHDRLGVPVTVTLKVATSADGMVARVAGRRDDVTGAAALDDVHRLRAVHDCVVVGIATALADRPRLDCRRLPAGVDREPTPVVFDRGLRLPADNAWSQAGREFVVVTGAGADAARARELERAGARVIRCDEDRRGVRVAHAVESLAAIGLRRILVEGGPRLLESFLSERAWDAFWHYRAPAEFGPAGLAFAAARDAASAPGVAVDESAFAPDVRRRAVEGGSWERLLALLSARSGEAN